MAAGPVRDDDALAAGLQRWLAHSDAAASGQLRGARIDTLRRPSSGWTNETVIVDLSPAGLAVRTAVLRMPPVVSSFPDQDVAFEAAVLQSLAPTPVPVPAVIATELDEQWVGAPFVAMTCVDGHVVGDVPALDEWLGHLGVDGQRARHEAFVAMLATLHRCDVDAEPVTQPMRDGIGDELEYWERYLAWASDGPPTRRLSDALAWCRETAPGPDRAARSRLWAMPGSAT
ncbi:MAG TPA: phosphotransferase [Acidimicrobiia bacterium]|jgi:aminoglycoside phosphotransferase (APT) family kinase protein